MKIIISMMMMMVKWNKIWNENKTKTKQIIKYEKWKSNVWEKETEKKFIAFFFRAPATHVSMCNRWYYCLHNHWNPVFNIFFRHQIFSWQWNMNMIRIDCEWKEKKKNLPKMDSFFHFILFSFILRKCNSKNNLLEFYLVKKKIEMNELYS